MPRKRGKTTTTTRYVVPLANGIYINSSWLLSCKMEEGESKKFETVSSKTFNKWPFKEDFRILETDDDGMIRKLLCKVCSVHLAAIRQEARRRQMRGTALTGLQNYANGISYAHKGNIMRHIKADGLHAWAKRKYLVSTSPVPSTTSSGRDTVKSDVPLNTTSKKHHVHLFVTALALVMRENPFADFAWLIELQRKNGVMFLTGKENEKACREFVRFLADSMREDLKNVLTHSNFFASLMDGSQARKTGDEKEAIFTKVVVNGSPVELFLQCQHMPDFGGETATAVKAAFDDAFLETYGIPVKRYSKLLTSVCADGAGVNMGGLNGACTKIKNEHNRDWMLIIHCANHRLELAVKDAFQADRSFMDVDEVLCEVYNMFRNSSKAKRLLRQTAASLGVACVSFAKSTGTRFQNHKYRATTAFVVNFLPLCIYAETVIEERNCPADSLAKLRGYLKKFKSYSFLASLHFYQQVLSAMSHLSYVMQTKSSLLTDVIDAIESTRAKLRELEEAEPGENLPFESTQNGDEVTLTADGEETNLPASPAFKSDNALTEKQKRRQEFVLTNVERGKQAVARIKETLLPAIGLALNKRFQSFLDSSEIFDALLITDHTTWDFDDDAFGRDKIAKLAEHFSQPLSHHGFVCDLAIKEFLQLKKLVRQRYRSFKNKISLWETIFMHFGNKFPHVLLLVELCLTIAYSSSTVERCFRTTRRILTDSRLSINKNTLNDLLLLRVNVPVMKSLDHGYEDKLVEKAVTKYMRASAKGRYKLKPSGRHAKEESTADSFLPTPFQQVNDLLKVDSHLTISDDSECESSDHEVLSESEDSEQESDAEECVVMSDPEQESDAAEFLVYMCDP